MLFSAKAEYACLAMLELAARHDDPKPIRLADIADKHGISQKFLVQILIQLKGAGLVASTRGASGGYQLARPPRGISLADILTVVDGTEAAGGKRERAAGAKADGTPESSALHEVWGKIYRAQEEFLKAQQKILKSTSLADLIESGHGLQYVI
jgi:Rrf2 family protein